MNFEDCIGCTLCAHGCPAVEETGFEVLSAKGRNRALQAGLQAADMKDLVAACTMCGYCDGICPKHVRNIELVLHLRRELNGEVKATTPKGAPLVLGCTVRERASHLIPSIQSFLKRLGRPTEVDDGCCGAREVEAGHATATVVRAGVIVDSVCGGQFRGEYLGELAMRNVGMFDLKAPFYYFVPNRLVNGDHARFFPLYDALRKRTGCETNIDMNRLARSTSASSHNPRDVKAAVLRLLAHTKAERVITDSPADYLAFREHSGRETRFITECLK